MNHVAIILAAGKGTRMKSSLPKVLHPVAGRPMLHWVVDAVRGTGPDRIVIVVGHGAELVTEGLDDGLETVVQEQQNGTGHAAEVGLRAFGSIDPDTAVLVVPGDAPLLDAAVLGRLVDRHREASASLTLTSTVLDDPSGYGRIIRRDDGSVSAVVEERDADPQTRLLDEVNAGMYVFRAGDLAEDLAELEADNAQGELYLTDVIGVASARGGVVVAEPAPAEIIAGVNDHIQLASAAVALRRRIAERWMREGVRMIDPDRVYLDHDVVLAPGVTLYPNVILEAGSTVDEGATVGPDVYASDSRIGPGSRVWYTVLRSSVVGEACTVGPYASLRPGSVIERGAHLGTFVETKNSIVGEGSKVPHLAYMGDATIGARVNVGAGSITCNYDGFAKHRTIIGDGAFIGSDTMLVAPVTIGEGAMTGAGSTISRDVGPGELGVERAKQQNVPGFVERLAARYRARRSDESPS